LQKANILLKEELNATNEINNELKVFNKQKQIQSLSFSNSSKKSSKYNEIQPVRNKKA
jgi:hypothetical protein